MTSQPPSGAGEARPVAYLVAERRGGRWMLGDDWVSQRDTLAEAQQEAEAWRSRDGDAEASTALPTIEGVGIPGATETVSTAYQAGFAEGHVAGYRAGLKETERAELLVAVLVERLGGSVQITDREWQAAIDQRLGTGLIIERPSPGDRSIYRVRL